MNLEHMLPSSSRENESQWHMHLHVSLLTKKPAVGRRVFLCPYDPKRSWSMRAGVEVLMSDIKNPGK